MSVQTGHSNKSGSIAKTFIRSLSVSNPGPYIEFSSNLTFEAGYTISDLSLIDGVTVRSEYNRFNSTDDPPIIIDSIVSYNQGTTTIFNQSNPTVGNYFIYYKATDNFNKENIRLRNLDIYDTEGSC